MDKITTNDQEVITTLRAVVAERPDYVYTNPFPDDAGTCRYVHGDTPGCLVGHVLHRLGVPLEELSRHEGKNACSVAADLLDGISSDASWAIEHAQFRQDLGDTWAEALKAAGQA